MSCYSGTILLVTLPHYVSPRIATAILIYILPLMSFQREITGKAAHQVRAGQ